MFLLDSISFPKHDVISECSVDIYVNLLNVWRLISGNPFHGLEKNMNSLLSLQCNPCKLNSQFSGNSQKFLTMQINSDLKSLELLGISGKGRLQFCEDLESLGIPRNSQLYKLPII